MITVKNNVFHLATSHTSYVFMIDGRGMAEHLYYGPLLRHPEHDVDALVPKRSVPRQGEVSQSEKDWSTNPSDLPQEASFEGGGDFRTPFIAIDESRGCACGMDLRYRHSETFSGIRRISSGLPQAIGSEDEVHGLRLDFQDDLNDITLSLYYTVFPSSDTIVRRAVVKNASRRTITLRKIASMQLDLYESGYGVTFFTGPWGRENRPCTHLLPCSTLVNESRTGFTGQSSNIFILEGRGSCIITGLMYCGDHKATIETGAYSTVHIVSGINEETIHPVLEPGEAFETPEAFMTLAADRSRCTYALQHFEENHIMRGTWRNRLRPVSFSTRHVLGLDVREDRVRDLIRLAGQIGFEMFVLDDGWFGVRNSKDDSVGDWSANPMKLPEGLAEVSRECHKAGMLFGVWLSPECASLHSRLAMEHPDWLVRNPRRRSSPIENGQYVLDITRHEVYEYVLETICGLIERTGIDAVRWSIGTQLADLWSRSDKPDGQWRHRYICAFYKLQRSIALSFPNLLIENTSDTGPRLDAGLLASSAIVGGCSLSDPFEQLDSFCGAVQIMPPSALSTMLASRRFNLEGRYTSFSSAFNIGLFGCLSYSIDLRRLSRKERQAIAGQLEFYRMYRHVTQFGRYRIRHDGQRTQISACDADASTILVLLAVRNMEANGPDDILYVEDAREDALYSLTRRDEDEEIVLGDDYYSAPPLEKESYVVGGDTLSHAGARLARGYQGGAYSEEMRVMGDHSTRLYVIKRIDREDDR